MDSEVVRAMRFSRKLFRTVAVQLAALAVLVGVAPQALAFVETPDDTWMTNGTVYAVVRSGDHVYVGGTFTKVSENAPGVAGDRATVVGITRFDAATGVADKSWKVDIARADGKRPTVYAIAVLDGKVFFGGQFDLVDGQPRVNIAAVSVADSTLDASFDPVMGNKVRAMIASGSTVYVGGYFQTVDGLARKRLAAFDGAGNLLNWKPRTGGSVRSLAFDCAGDSVYAGGLFEQAAGPTGSLVTRDSIARFDAANGTLENWQTRDAEIGNGAVAYDLAVSCASDQIFAGIGGVNFVHAFDTSDDDGQTTWVRQTAGNVQTVAVNDFGTADAADDRVYFGGHFGGGATYPSGTCSLSKPKTARFGVADLDGNCDLSWWPTFEGKFYGPWDILVTDNGDRVWVGGQFTQVCDGSGGSGGPCVDQYFVARFTDV